MKIFVIADTHFWHENIIRYCNRPFKSVEEMNAVLIKNWNETVSKNDIVIHLGDFSLGTKEQTREVAAQLTGKKILIIGNHDRWTEQFYRDIGFHTVSRFPIIYDNFFIMSHAPLQLSETTPYYNCYGHIHQDNKYLTETATSKCFCVERHGYRPVLLYEKK